MDEKDKIFADPAQRAVLRTGDASLNYYTLDEAVRANAARSAAGARNDQGGKFSL
jgi:hypothetical protein